MSTVLITGASRGLGLEFARQYAAAGWDVIATARDLAAAADLADVKRRAAGNVVVERLDVTHPGQVEWLAGKFAETPIDVLINNAGDLGPRGGSYELIHQQYFGSINYDAWRALFEVNTMAPIRVAEAFTEHVQRSEQRKMVFMSSTVGSVTEGEYNVFPYCSSKAALTKCVSMLARAVRDRGIIAAAVCPGHVRTAMGGPTADVEARDSVAGLRKLIARLAPKDSGSFTRYDGQTIAW